MPRQKFAAGGEDSEWRGTPRQGQPLAPGGTWVKGLTPRRLSGSLGIGKAIFSFAA
ncbi:MAG: hypothetical protein JWM33_1345 [Caulobacteraceae bacterium]|nr:hypothetical protein [Caulobacteraceae bacterium]